MLHRGVTPNPTSAEQLAVASGATTIWSVASPNATHPEDVDDAHAARSATTSGLSTRNATVRRERSRMERTSR